MLLVSAPQPWAQTEPPKKGQATVLGCPHNPHPAQGCNGTAWISFLSHQCRRSSSVPEGLALPICLCQRKNISLSSHSSSSGNKKIKPPQHSPLPSVPSHTELGGTNPSLGCPDSDTTGKSCSLREKLLRSQLGRSQDCPLQCQGDLAQPQQPRETQAIFASHPGAPTFVSLPSTATFVSHPQPKSITAACVTLAAIKGFKQQFLTFMNK